MKEKENEEEEHLLFVVWTMRVRARARAATMANGHVCVFACGASSSDRQGRRRRDVRSAI